jgi:hypothetical protein
LRNSTTRNDGIQIEQEDSPIGGVNARLHIQGSAERTKTNPVAANKEVKSDDKILQKYCF